MIPARGLIKTLKGWLGKPIAGPETDPLRFFGTMYALPNPDPILREMGQAERVYQSIMSDPHVLGDMRSIRGNFRSHDYRVVSGDEGNSQAEAARQLCEDWLQRTRPNEMVDWLEVMWQMSSAFASGYRVHEMVLDAVDSHWLPTLVMDRPNRRVRFNTHGEPLLISIGNPLGAPVEPHQLVISRHMPTLDNPYGVATLSSCFWAWTFKTGGWRFFLKYCERHGLPWPIARYPAGTSNEDQDKLAEALQNMIESAYAVVPDGTGIELLVPTSSGSNLPQRDLIDLCNIEMSKALTGQSMVGELRGVGARAASETALKRQESIDDSVRDIAGQSMDFIFRWITLFNLGDGIAPPTLEFYRRGTGGKDRAETYEVAKRIGANPSKRAFLEEMGIPSANGPDDMLVSTPPASPSQPPVGGASAAASGPAIQARTEPNDGKTGDSIVNLSSLPGLQFARAAGMSEDEAIQLASQAADQAIEAHMIAPIARMLARYESDGRTLAEFHADLQGMVGVMDDTALREVLDRALSFSMLHGAATHVD